MISAGIVAALLPIVLLLFLGAILAFVPSRRRGDAAARTGPPRTRSSVTTWLLSLAATTAACVLGVLAGIGLGLFGLALIALLGSLALIAFAGFVWHRGALPLALVAASLAAGATLAAASPQRMDRSTGLLAVTPRIGAEVNNKELTRGLGSVLVDLRETRLARGSSTTITARSDAGRIVVALPADRCVNLRVRAHQPYRDPSEAANLVMAIASRNGVLPSGERSPTPIGAFDRSIGIDGRQLIGPEYPQTPVMVAFGQTVTAGRSGIAHWRRTTAATDAPTVVLDLTAPAIVVRDYPAGTTALGRKPSRQERALGWDQDEYAELRGSAWPGETFPAPSFIPMTADQATNAGAFPAPARQLEGRAWKRAAIKGAATAARLAAGPCATRTALRSSRMRFTDLDGTLVLVDGLGRVVRS